MADSIQGIFPYRAKYFASELTRRRAAAKLLVVRSANEVTNEIDAFVRQARRKPQP